MLIIYWEFWKGNPEIDWSHLKNCLLWSWMVIKRHVFLYIFIKITSINCYFWVFSPFLLFKVKKSISYTIFLIIQKTYFFTFQYLWNWDAYYIWQLPTVSVGPTTIRILLPLRTHLWGVIVITPSVKNHAVSATWTSMTLMFTWNLKRNP